MNQIVLLIVDMTVITVPEDGQLEFDDYRVGYIVAPGYPGNYRNRANGSVVLTTPSHTVSLLVYHFVNQQMYQ